jgi:hypothetical protein
LPGEFEAIERLILQPVNREDDRIEKTVPNAQNIYLYSSQSVIQSVPQKENAGRDLPVTNLITTLSPRNETRESEGLGGIQEFDLGGSSYNHEKKSVLRDSSLAFDLGLSESYPFELTSSQALR